MLSHLPTERVTTALRMLSVEAGLSQEKLGAKVGMSQSAIARRLSGDTPIDLVDLAEIATALGYSVRISFIENSASAPPAGVDAAAPAPTGTAATSGAPEALPSAVTPKAGAPEHSQDEA